MSNILVAEVEVLRPLLPHTVVRCPDGVIGEVSWSSSSEVHVLHNDMTIGRGPWYFALHQVEQVVDPAEVAAYRNRCAVHSLRIV